MVVEEVRATTQLPLLQRRSSLSWWRWCSYLCKVPEAMDLVGGVLHTTFACGDATPHISICVRRRRNSFTWWMRPVARSSSLPPPLPFLLPPPYNVNNIGQRHSKAYHRQRLTRRVTAMARYLVSYCGGGWRRRGRKRCC